MLTYIDMGLSRNSGRIRYDYLQRLEKSVAVFEKELKTSVAVVADKLRVVLQPETGNSQPASSMIAQLDFDWRTTAQRYRDQNQMSKTAGRESMGAGSCCIAYRVSDCLDGITLCLDPYFANRTCLGSWEQALNVFKRTVRARCLVANRSSSLARRCASSE